MSKAGWNDSLKYFLVKITLFWPKYSNNKLHTVYHLQVLQKSIEYKNKFYYIYIYVCMKTNKNLQDKPVLKKS